MSPYQFTPQAVDDLLDIWSFIANDNLDAADRVETAIFSGRFPFRRNDKERSDRLTCSLLGRAAVFELSDRLRSIEEAASSHPNPSRRSRPSSHPDLAREIDSRFLPSFCKEL